MKKRVIFSKRNQKDFMSYLKFKSSLGWTRLAKKLKVNESTLSKAYMFSLSSIPYELFKDIATLLKKEPNTLLKRYDGKIVEETLIIGRKVIGEQKKKFEEINITFKNENLELDNSSINYSSFDLDKDIRFPNQITPELAEEIGMHYGDGFLSAKRCDYRLKGNPANEQEYYLNYIKPLFKKLYNLEVKLKDFKTSFGFEISSKALWEFKTKIIGIRPGNKRNLTIPERIKVNNLRILTSFLRGLFDTDGCVNFKTRYGYERYYPNITLALFSKNVVKEAGEILKMLGFNPNVYLDEEYSIISLNGIGALKRYEKLIGWNSPKNLKKVEDWKNRYPKLSMVDVAQW